MFERSQTPAVTRNLLIVNILFFAAMKLGGTGKMISALALFYPTSYFFHWWQWITYMFMHGSFFHIFFNMYTLYIFGSVLENMIGSKKFFVFYMLCGLGAALLHFGVQAAQIQVLLEDGSASSLARIAELKATPTVGASGAIYGLLLGYAMLFPASRLTLIFPPVTFSAKTMVIVFAGIELLTGVLATGDGIAHFAHLGGMAVGALLMLYWRKRGRLFDRDIWI